MSENSTNSYKEPGLEKRICLFCREIAGSDSGVEHIIPQSLGNNNLFLDKGIVCKKCNNELGKLDDNFVHNSFNVLFKLIQNFKTKKGRLPSTILKDIILRKNVNGTINVLKKKRYNINDEIFNINKDGTAIYQCKFHQVIYPTRISKFLAKAGLETLYYQRNEFAFKNRFDDLRNYAIGKGSIKFIKFGFKELNASSAYTRITILSSLDEIIYNSDR